VKYDKKKSVVVFMSPVPVAAYVYGRLPAAIVGSIPTGAWMFVVCCQAELSATN
jgi:hypothetical protein